MITKSRILSSGCSLPVCRIRELYPHYIYILADAVVVGTEYTAQCIYIYTYSLGRLELESLIEVSRSRRCLLYVYTSSVGARNPRAIIINSKPSEILGICLLLLLLLSIYLRRSSSSCLSAAYTSRVLPIRALYNPREPY